METDALNGKQAHGSDAEQAHLPFFNETSAKKDVARSPGPAEMKYEDKDRVAAMDKYRCRDCELPAGHSQHLLPFQVLLHSVFDLPVEKKD